VSPQVFSSDPTCQPSRTVQRSLSAQDKAPATHTCVTLTRISPFASCRLMSLVSARFKDDHSSRGAPE
jgi:hypothetical protein